MIILPPQRRDILRLNQHTCIGIAGRHGMVDTIKVVLAVLDLHFSCREDRELAPDHFFDFGVQHSVWKTGKASQHV